jgi:hypothetical protein
VLLLRCVHPFDPLSSPDRFRIALDRCDLALQPTSLCKRDCKLLLKLADIGMELVDAAEVLGAMMDADNNKQPEKRRNKKSNPEIQQVSKMSVASRSRGGATHA